MPATGSPQHKRWGSWIYSGDYAQIHSHGQGPQKVQQYPSTMQGELLLPGSDGSQHYHYEESYKQNLAEFHAELPNLIAINHMWLIKFVVN